MHFRSKELHRIFNLKIIFILTLTRMKTPEIAFLVNHRPFTLPKCLDVSRESYKRLERCAFRQLVTSSARLHL